MIRLRLRHRDTDKGFVLVWTAVMLVLMMLMAALAVDLGFWYRNKNQAQQAADAAAAAGVTYRLIGSTDADAQAVSAALAAAKRNGFDDADPNDVVEVSTQSFETGEQLPRNQLAVRVTRKSPNFFLSIVGMDSSTVQAVSVAEYEPPIGIGSPCNTLGRQPGGAQAAGTPCEGGANASQLWLDIHGPQTAVYNGDQYSAENCAASAAGVPAVCDGGVNQSWQQLGRNGYDYVVRVLPGGEGRPVNVEIYDPAFTWTGASCDQPYIQRLKVLSTSYNDQAKAGFDGIQRQRNDLLTSIAEYNANITSVEKRLNDLIGWTSGASLSALLSAPGNTSAGAPSQLKALRAGSLGGVPNQSGFWLGSTYFITSANSQWQREWEITHTYTSLPTTWFSFTPPSGAFFAGVNTTQYRGTYLFTYKQGFFPDNLNPSLHGKSSSTWFPPPATWSTQHDSAVDLDALRTRLVGFRTADQSALDALPDPLPPYQISQQFIDRIGAADYEASATVPDLPYCAGDTAFLGGSAAYTSVQGCAGVCGGPVDIGMPKRGRTKVEPTADLPIVPRPATRYQLLPPGSSSAPISGCDETFGGFTERRAWNPPTPASSGASVHSELFRVLSKELDLKFQPGMPDNGFWNWLIKDVPGETPAPAVTGDDSGYGHSFVNTFHNWVSLCTFIPDAAGDYRLRVDTNSAPLAIGANRFSLRATNSVEGGEFLRVFGSNRMNLLLNAGAGAADNSAFVSEIIPADYDRALQIQFHDPGDVVGCQMLSSKPGFHTAGPDACAVSGSTASTFVIPEGAISTNMTGFRESITLTGATGNPSFSTCRYTFDKHPTASSFGPPVSPCRIPGLQGSGVSATNGALLTVQFALPKRSAADGFNCNSTTNPLDCWLKGTFEFSGLPVGTTLYPQDVTTWSVKLTGDPLRFVDN